MFVVNGLSKESELCVNALGKESELCVNALGKESELCVCTFCVMPREGCKRWVSYVRMVMVSVLGKEYYYL